MTELSEPYQMVIRPQRGGLGRVWDALQEELRTFCISNINFMLILGMSYEHKCALSCKISMKNGLIFVFH